MGQGSVLLRANADFNRLDRAYAQVTNRVQRLEAQNATLIGKMKQMEKSGTSGAGNISRSVRNMANQYLGARAVIQSVTAAMRDQIDVARRAHYKDITLARADADLVMAAMDFEPGDRRAMKAWTREKTVGWAEAEKTATLAEGLSQTTAEKGQPESTRIKDVIEMAEAFMPLFTTRKEEAGSLIGTGLALRRSLDGNAKQLASLLAAVRSQSSLKDLESLKEVVTVAAAANVTSREDATPLEQQRNVVWALAAQAAFMSRIGETGGAISKTGMANFLAQLREAIPEGRTHEERLRMLQTGDAKRRDEFIAHLMGRAATKPIAEELVRGGKTFQMAQGIMPRLWANYRDTSAYDKAVKDAMGMTPALVRQRSSEEGAAIGDKYLRETKGFQGAVYEQMFGEGKGLDNLSGVRNWFIKKYAQGIFLGSSAFGEGRGGSVRAAELAVGETIEAAKDFGTYTPALEKMLNEVIAKIQASRIEEQRTEREEANFEYLREQRRQKENQEAERRGQNRGAAAAHARGHSE